MIFPMWARSVSLGRCHCNYIVAFWENLNCPKKMNIVELGGGNGEMLKQILSSSEKFPDFNKSCNFFIHEKSPFLVKIQKFRLGESKVITNGNGLTS